MCVLRCGKMSQLGDHQMFGSYQSSSGSTANTLCSMETLELCEGLCSEDEKCTQNANDDDLPWGRLFPLKSHFKSLDLTKNTYTFGRGDECDYSFNIPGLKSLPSFLAYSKIHFKLVRETTSTGCHTFMEDLSSNGTFINGTKVGKYNKQVLNNNDEVSLALNKNKAFVYMDLAASNDNEYPQEIRDRFTVSKLLGRGACGEVRLAFEKGTCQRFAMKIISKKAFSGGGKTHVNLASHVMNEVRVMKALHHPCIISIEDVIDTIDTLYIILELVEGGELFDRVVQLGQLEESTAKLLFYQMIVAVKYLHDQGITHRDLKPENVLLSADDKETLIKVTDFGLSKFVDSNSLMKTFCGTPNYLAPEVLQTAGSGSYTKAIDCWSLGVILFICLGGYPPFSEDYKDELPLHRQIVTGRYSFPKDYWDGISKDAIDMIKKLLTVDPLKRMTLDEALRHTWLQDAAMIAKAQELMYPDLINGMASPFSRPSSKPKLKRQREESDETLEGEVSNDSSDGVPHKRPNLEEAVVPDFT